MSYAAQSLIALVAGLAIAACLYLALSGVRWGASLGVLNND